MTRRIAMMSVLGLLAAGLGCKHVGGKCDYGSHPGDDAMPALTAPYAAVPATTNVPPIPPANGKTPPPKPE